MNIEDLTIKQARELVSLFQFSQNGAAKPHPAVGRYCVIRAYAAGVHVGIVVAVNDSQAGREVELHDTRRVWSWQGALSCTEIAALRKITFPRYAR